MSSLEKQALTKTRDEARRAEIKATLTPHMKRVKALLSDEWLSTGEVGAKARMQRPAVASVLQGLHYRGLVERANDRNRTVWRLSAEV